MKKMLILITVLAMVCSLAVPVLADGTADQRLAEVTALVKKTLGLDTEKYTNFYGELEENPLAPTWDLEWYNEDGESLSVLADEDGKILSYYTYGGAVSTPASGFAPAFPEGDLDSARSAAEAFLKKVLTKGESILPDEDPRLSLGATSYRFYGEILLNGLSVGLTYSITVRCSDNEVIRFYRDDLTGTVMGGVPSPTPAVTADKAASVLRETLSLRLEYVLDSGETKAVLRWLPNWGDEYYVDGASGNLVNLTELYEEIAEGDKGIPGFGGANDSANGGEAAAPEGGLSPAEQEGIAKLEGVKSREELDETARAISALGLDKYTLSTVSYSVARDTEEGEEPLVTAFLRYGRLVEDYTWRRNVTLNARTGELLSVYSSGRLPDGMETSVTMEQARKNAEDFLKVQEPERFVKTELYDSSDLRGIWSFFYSFTFAQKENGYFFPDNCLNVEIDATDGSVSDYSRSFNDEVTFDSAEGVCSADEAVDAWLGTYEAKLQYIRVPAAIDFSQPEYAPLEGMGIGYLYKLVLGYQLERDRNPLGIDAKTAEPVYPIERTDLDRFTYTDLDGHWAKAQIETLGAYRVGFTGGVFEPGKELTQLDLVTLLMSTQGYIYDPAQGNSADVLYEVAYNMGILTREERDDGAKLTRAETLKMIMDASGYGPVARLKGIFRTDFTDDKDIPEAYYGYAALAQGLGIVSGTPDGRFLPGTPSTRAEAAVMLYNLMDR